LSLAAPGVASLASKDGTADFLPAAHPEGRRRRFDQLGRQRRAD
jgi:hypothetical protein